MSNKKQGDALDIDALVERAMDFFLAAEETAKSLPEDALRDLENVQVDSAKRRGPRKKQATRTGR